MKTIFKRISFGIASLTLAFSVQAQQPAFISNDLDNYIRKGMEQWQVPGLAIVIVKDGKVVWQKGYGVKNIESKDPVDEHTRFFIASNSKLFTGLTLANLETQGKLNLNDPITKYFPEYKLFDATSTSLVSIRDMLSHRIGTKTFQGDFTFWNTDLNRAQIMERMRLMKPSSIFRQDYGYCNSCFMTAGEVVPKVIGITWEQYVQDSILKPIGMSESQASSNGIEKRVSNIATPYTTSYTGTLQTVPYDRWDNLGPAASVVSNVNDLGKWLLFQLDSGKVNGKQIMPWSSLRKTRIINTMTRSVKSAAFPINFSGYGLGLFAGDYNGRQFYWHTGGAAGMVSNVCFVPDENLGIAILTNNDNQNFFEALRYQVLDAYLGVAYRDRSQMMWPGFQREMQDQLKEISQWKNRVKGSQPPLDWKAYTGQYSNEMYGSITVAQKDGKLIVHFEHHPDMTATLQYMDNNEWLMEYSNIEYGIFSTNFSAGNNKVQSLRIPMNPFVELDAYTFVKQ
jgi:CubicO group peptidase (beta-lactamase class C family)